MVSIRRALVLSSGGLPGAAWMLGMLEGLRDGGLDLSKADLVVGTSAGALAGAPLAGGVLDRAVALYGRSEISAFQAPATFDQFMAATARVAADALDPHEAVRRIANLDPLGASLISEEDVARLFDALLPIAAWPQKRIIITVTDTVSGLRAVFDADSGVLLTDAVRASCAVPGVFPSVAIQAGRYVDGGLCSPYNVDLAAGNEVVILLSPLRPNPYLQRLIDAEIPALGDVTVHMIGADEPALSAIGSDLLSGRTTQAALDAGRSQAARESDRLGSIWHAGEQPSS